MPKTTCTCRIVLAVLLTATSLMAQPAGTPQAAGPFQLLKTLHIGGEGGWDYITVDSKNKLLYGPRTTHTMVIQEESGKVVADMPGQERNHGVALVPAAGRGFISDGKAAAVFIFDTKTHKVLGKVKAADDADGIIYDPASNKVLTACGDANEMVPLSPDVDPQTGKADAGVELGGKPVGLVADEKGKVYIALVDKNLVAVVNTKTMKVLAKWPTVPGGSPVGMSMDRAHGLLFVGCRNPQKLLVMSVQDGKILADLPIGAGCDGTRFDKGYAFASCRDGTLAVAHENAAGKFELVQTVQTKPGARTLDVDPATHCVYLPTAEFGQQRVGRSRPVPKPNTFEILVVGSTQKLHR